MKNYKKTKLACYLGFITQAVAANFAPLLFLKFHTDYNISLGNIAMISTSFFFTQLLVDLFCAKYVDKIGYRVCIVASEVCSAAGLVGLAFLPEIIPSPFIGIIISVILYAIGSGLIEVLGSPIVEACPFENKEAMAPYVRRMDFIIGVQAAAPHGCAVVSWNGTAYINCIRNIREPELELHFYQVLHELGLPVKAESNQR